MSLIKSYSTLSCICLLLLLATTCHAEEEYIISSKSSSYLTLYSGNYNITFSSSSCNLTLGFSQNFNDISELTNSIPRTFTTLTSQGDYFKTYLTLNAQTYMVFFNNGTSNCTCNFQSSVVIEKEELSSSAVRVTLPYGITKTFTSANPRTNLPSTLIVTSQVSSPITLNISNRLYDYQIPESTPPNSAFTQKVVNGFETIQVAMSYLDSYLAIYVFINCQNVEGCPVTLSMVDSLAFTTPIIIGATIGSIAFVVAVAVVIIIIISVIIVKRRTPKKPYSTI